MFDFLRRPAAAGIGAVLLATALMLSPGPSSFIAGLSIDTLFWLRDQAFGQRRPARENPVAAILIDEATYDTPPFRGLSKELWTPQLATVLRAVNAAGPRAIGMDFVLPTSMENFQPGYEREFRLALKEAADAGRMVLAKVQGQGPPVLPTREQILAVGGLANVRSVNLPQDDDGIIRHAPLHFPRTDGRGPETAFAYELARRADPSLVPPPGEQILLNFDGGTPFLIFSLADIYACAAAGNAAFFAAQFKGKVEYCRIGPPAIVAAVKRYGAIFAFEESGKVIYPEINYLSDSGLAAAHILEHLAEHEVKFSALVDELPKYYQQKRAIDCPNTLKKPVVDYALKTAKTTFSDAEVVTIDGVKIVFDDGWLLLRPSGTEPVFRCFSEARTEARARALLRLGLDWIAEAMKQQGAPVSEVT